MIDADYFWKRTRNAYDFSVILNTPITFPISWHLAKSDGFSARVNLSDYKGLGLLAAGHTRARFPWERRTLLQLRFAGRRLSN